MAEYNENRLLKQMEEVRQSGEVNMVNHKGVQAVAHKLGLYDLVLFIDDDRRGRKYRKLLKKMD